MEHGTSSYTKKKIFLNEAILSDNRSITLHFINSLFYNKNFHPIFLFIPLVLPTSAINKNVA